jgi:c-di-GMP-binding flagellar brake protein YcgR
MITDIPGVSDRRKTPRYEIELSVDLVLDNGSNLTVTSRNISSCGLQIRCDAWVTEEIEPRGIQNHAISHIRMKAIADLPIGDETKKLYSNSRIMSVQRMSQDEYMLNLAFVDFENGSEEVLDKFLDQFEQKKTVINSHG